MRAITISNYGGPEMLTLTEEQAKPEPEQPTRRWSGSDAAGVNFVDIYQRRGMYPVKLPFIPGLEAAGVVESIGETGQGCPGRGPGKHIPGTWAATASIQSSRLRG